MGATVLTQVSETVAVILDLPRRRGTSGLRGWATVIGAVACVATLGWLVTAVIWTLP